MISKINKVKISKINKFKFWSYDIWEAAKESQSSKFCLHFPSPPHHRQTFSWEAIFSFCSIKAFQSRLFWRIEIELNLSRMYVCSNNITLYGLLGKNSPRKYNALMSIFSYYRIYIEIFDAIYRHFRNVCRTNIVRVAA